MSMAIKKHYAEFFDYRVDEDQLSEHIEKLFQQAYQEQVGRENVLWERRKQSTSSSPTGR